MKPKYNTLLESAYDSVRNPDKKFVPDPALGVIGIAENTVFAQQMDEEDGPIHYIAVHQGKFTFAENCYETWNWFLEMVEDNSEGEDEEIEIRTAVASHNNEGILFMIKDNKIVQIINMDD